MTLERNEAPKENQKDEEVIGDLLKIFPSAATLPECDLLAWKRNALIFKDRAENLVGQIYDGDVSDPDAYESFRQSFPVVLGSEDLQSLIGATHVYIMQSVLEGKIIEHLKPSGFVSS